MRAQRVGSLAQPVLSGTWVVLAGGAHNALSVWRCGRLAEQVRLCFGHAGDTGRCVWRSRRAWRAVMVDVQQARGQILSTRADDDDDDDDDGGNATILTKNTPPSTFRARLPVTFVKWIISFITSSGLKKIIESFKIPTKTMQFLILRSSLGLKFRKTLKLLEKVVDLNKTLVRSPDLHPNTNSLTLF